MYCIHKVLFLKEVNVLHLSSVETPGRGYAPIPGLQHAASLATVSADEDIYIALYEYAAQVITMDAFFSIFFTMLRRS